MVWCKIIVDPTNLPCLPTDFKLSSTVTELTTKILSSLSLASSMLLKDHYTIFSRFEVSNRKGYCLFGREVAVSCERR